MRINNKVWELLGAVPFVGSTAVISGSEKAGRWLAAPAGLYHFVNGRWQLRQKQIPFWHVNTVAVSENIILAGGLPKGILRSGASGRAWGMAWTEQTDLPITCIVPSPKTRRDGVWLAGTQGDGILRSTDNGRHWELANWGLQDFTVLDIVPAPTWGEREYVFAITLEGFYQSPNGGRAWRFVGEPFQDDPPLACAVSPQFGVDCALWVVTESGAIFESTDMGHSFQRLDHSPSSLVNDLSINRQGNLLAAGAGIYRSQDNGRSWQQTAHPALEADQQILKLNHVGQSLYATLLNGGVWHSEDDGATWTAVSDLSSGRFMWIEPSSHGLLIGGPHVGLWQLESQALQTSAKETAVLAFAHHKGALLISRPAGIYRDGALLWALETSLIRLLSADERLWGVDENGRLWQENQGEWHIIKLPAPVIDLAANADCLVIAMADRGRKEIAVGLQRHDAPGQWHKVTEMPSSDYRAKVAIDGDQIVLAAGRSARVVDWASRAVETAVLADKAAPLIALAHEPIEGLTAVASLEKVWLTADYKEWVALPDSPHEEVIADLAFVVQDGQKQLVVLMGDGRVWALQVE